MKRLTFLTTLALLLLLLALPTLAAGPTIIVNGFGPFFIPAANGCGAFDVSVTPEAGKPNGGRIILFANVAIFQGPVFATLTNDSTGKSVSLNISGPAKAIFATNTEVLKGPTLLVGFTAPAPPNLQGVVLAHGQTVVKFDPVTGNLISVSFNGTTENVCPLLG